MAVTLAMIELSEPTGVQKMLGTCFVGNRTTFRAFPVRQPRANFSTGVEISAAESGKLIYESPGVPLSRLGLVGLFVSRVSTTLRRTRMCVFVYEIEISSHI